jgi:uncharacterized protein
MPSNRREFLTRAARALGSGALCTSTAAPKDLLANVAWPEELFGKALFAKMKWFNQPASATQSGDQLVVRTKPKTDYWRKTFYDYVTDNGHFFFLPVIGDFALGKLCRRKIQRALRSGRADGADRQQQLAEVRPRTRRSYRSRQRRPYTRVLRLVHHSRHHHERTAVVAHRSKRLFPRSFLLSRRQSLISTRLGYLPMPASVDAGTMCCSPEGAGFESTFDQIRFTH